MNREINFELIPAIYGPEGYEFNQVDFPDKYEKLKNDSVYCEGFILAEVFEDNGRKFTRFVLNGSDESLKYVYDKLQGCKTNFVNEQQKEIERLKALYYFF